MSKTRKYVVEDDGNGVVAGFYKDKVGGEPISEGGMLVLPVPMDGGTYSESDDQAITGFLAETGTGYQMFESVSYMPDKPFILIDLAEDEAFADEESFGALVNAIAEWINQKSAVSPVVYSTDFRGLPDAELFDTGAIIAVGGRAMEHGF